MVDPLVMTLRGIQADADNKGVEAPMTWDALNSINTGLGSPNIDYDRFAAQWEAEGEEGVLHQLVARFDGNGVVIKTKDQEGEQPQQGQEKEAESEISKMAKRVTRKKFG